MKSAYLILSAAVAFCMVLSCNNKVASDPGADTTPVIVPNTSITHSNARLVSAAYSQPIKLDTANKMISSYVASIGYPNRDTAIRALSFDADTVRAYLTDSRITTLKFVLGHQLSYLNGGSNRFGKNIGMTPGKLTIIMVGIDDNGAVVKNSSGGVYEHAMPCPNSCGPETDAYLY